MVKHTLFEFCDICGKRTAMLPKSLRRGKYKFCQPRCANLFDDAQKLYKDSRINYSLIPKGAF